MMARVDGVGDLYDLLGLPRNADPPTIRRVYRELARALLLEPSQQPETAERFRELTHAFEVLSNPGSRQVYDRLSLGYVHAAGDWESKGDDELVAWVFGAERLAEAPRGRGIVPAGDQLVRLLAAVGVVIALILLLAVLARG